jgi:hypothetical protein
MDSLILPGMGFFTFPAQISVDQHDTWKRRFSKEMLLPFTKGRI